MHLAQKSGERGSRLVCSTFGRERQLRPIPSRTPSESRGDCRLWSDAVQISKLSFMIEHGRSKVSSCYINRKLSIEVKLPCLQFAIQIQPKGQSSYLNYQNSLLIVRTRKCTICSQQRRTERLMLSITMTYHPPLQTTFMSSMRPKVTSSTTEMSNRKKT